MSSCSTTDAPNCSLNKSSGRPCIASGAALCLNGCPIYKGVGGHAYGSTYSGPIGSVITPHYKGMEEFKHLSYASSLCGKCTEVCPVRIELHKLLLLNRRDSVDQHTQPRSENWVYAIWKGPCSAGR